jgi:molybdate transport system regulatory protein
MIKPIKPIVSIRLLRNNDDLKTSFGPGTASLLRGIEKTGSLNQATKSMGMAYSKAWRVLNVAEKQLGFSLVERKGPNGSVLTEKGRQFLQMYNEMQQAVNNAAQAVLDNTKYKF